jgi:lysophospholipid acyltransferase (LPLAT)-like uncharacterized protein
MSHLIQPASGIVVPQQAPWHGRLAAGLVFALIRGVSATVRYRWAPQPKTYPNILNQPAIFCVWHNRLSLCLVVYHKLVQVHFPDRRLAAMVSASKDGGMLTRVLEHFGVQPVRGSSSRRGRQALLELTSWAEQGLDLAITPDGPRGPRYIVQDGIAALAQLTGFPIVPVSYFLSSKVCLKSWDRFQIPLPFARCEIRLGEPVLIPRGCSDAEREDLRMQLERTLRDITRD